MAAGHRATVEAAAAILEAGGNAFDAAAAAFFAACVAEPVLCSPAGGGFLLARHGDRTVVYDFFTQTPLGKRPSCDFYPVLADFGDTQQEFHLGAGSWATPGAIPGVLEFQGDLGRLPFKTIVQPAVQLAREGVEVTAFSAHLMNIVSAIYLRSEAGRKLFGNPDRPKEPLQAGQRFRSDALAALMEGLAEDPGLIREGEVAQTISRCCQELGGHLSVEDFKQYQVYRREPLVLRYRGGTVTTNPVPSMGGSLIGLALELLQDYPLKKLGFGSAPHLECLVRVQGLLNQYKRDFQNVDSGVWGTDPGGTRREELRSALRRTLESHAASTEGTTHVSILDAGGNAAALSVSNGSGSGFVVEDYAFTMNNMLGEEDLNPNGFHQWQPNLRMASMMAPTFIEKDESFFITGSGGSNRIRSAILQVISNLIDFDMDLEAAVTAPRVHYEHGTVNIEPGFPDTSMDHLQVIFEPVLSWKEKGVFFGGTHSVGTNKDTGLRLHQGDPRRCGIGIKL